MKKINMRKARDKYSQIMHEVGYLNERYILCKVNKPMAVLVSWNDWEVIEAMYREIDEKRKLKE
jgi:PHD/YefM family antitoxin component YafN of YafNO toxin-antitoxin module